jgi:hypothetical protein
VQLSEKTYAYDLQGIKKEKELKRVWNILPALNRSFPSLFGR